MKIAIIVLNWNQRDATLACLDSLRRADLQGAEVIVVDNGSRDGSVEAIRARFPAQRIVALPENRGYAGGNNAGMRAALEDGAEAVLLLNNDTRVTPDFLLPLIWTLDAHPRAAAVCSAIHRLDYPEVLDVAYSEVRFDQRDAVKICGVNALPGQGFDTRREVEVAVGCCVLMRAEALRAVGLFDEAYFAYHEDVDWCLRARKAGWQMFYEPFSRVFHVGSASTRNDQAAGSPERPRSATFFADSEAAMLGRGATRGMIAVRTDVTTCYILEADDPARLESWVEFTGDLPNAEPMPFNPVRTYMGARNLVRLQRAHATAGERRAFRQACLYEIPLEFLAVVLGREGWLRFGRWTYRDAARCLFIERHPSLARAAGAARTLRLLVLVPVDVLWSFPRATWRAWRAGRLAQLLAYTRGLWDGLWNRPLPLARLGLRGNTSHR